MIFGIDRKKRCKKVRSEKNQELQDERREVEVGTLLLSNDKNNVIAYKVLSCF